MQIDVASGAAVVQAAWRAGWMPKARLGLAQWADAHRVLSGKSASEPGPWRTSRAPYMYEPMECLSEYNNTPSVVLWFGTQSGKSELINNWIGYSMDCHPCPMILVQPTLSTAKRYSKMRVQPLIEKCESLARKVHAPKSRDSGNTRLEKEFEGDGVLIITGANSGADLRSMPIRYAAMDEIDAWPNTIDGEGDPIALVEARLDTFGDQAKRCLTSTCTIKGDSNIESAYLASSQGVYEVPCPHCGHEQVLVFEQLKWVDGDPSTAHYQCAACFEPIAEHQKTEMLASGKWVHKHPENKARGFWLNSLYSPVGWSSWAKIVTEFLKATAAAAQGDTSALQVWTNARAAQTWEIKGSGLEPHLLQQRAEAYPLRILPRGALLLVASVDVQDDRLEYAVYGYGKNEESWIVDVGVIYASPAQTSTWQTLDDQVLLARYRNAWGMDVKIRATCIDTGGHHTHQVYEFCRQRTGRNVRAVKGSSYKNKPVISKPTLQDVTVNGRVVKNGVQLWYVGTDTAKGVLFGRLALTEKGAGYIHFSDELTDDFYKQLTSERLQTRYHYGRPVQEWRCQKGVRNEQLDLWVYAYAAFVSLGAHRWRGPEWDKLEAALQPALFDPDLLQENTAATQNAAPKTEQPDPITNAIANIASKIQQTPASKPQNVPKKPSTSSFATGWKK